MTIMIVTNSFTASHVIYPEPMGGDIYYDYITLPSVESMEELSFTPLLTTSNVYTHHVQKLEPKTMSSITGYIKDMHKNNVLILCCSPRDSIQLQNRLTYLSIPYSTLNCNYLPKDMFDDYVRDVGFSPNEATDELYKRLKGNLSNSLTYLIELANGKNIDRVIAAETRADYSTFIGVFLGIDTSVVKQRRMLRVLRKEHPAYLKAILKNQLKDIITLKENQKTLQTDAKASAKLKVDKRMRERYIPLLHMVSLPSLYQIQKRLEKTKATEPKLTELIMWVWSGGYMPREEEII